jgi:hypothetical protein
MKTLSALFCLVAICLFTATKGVHVAPLRRFEHGDHQAVIDRRGPNMSQKLFSSLEELARIVDITYCVGTTGIYKPFRCAGRCREFEGFELVTVGITKFGPFLGGNQKEIHIASPFFFCLFLLSPTPTLPFSAKKR